MIESDKICKVLSEGKSIILKILIKLMEYKINKQFKINKNLLLLKLPTKIYLVETNLKRKHKI